MCNLHALSLSLLYERVRIIALITSPIRFSGGSTRLAVEQGSNPFGGLLRITSGAIRMRQRLGNGSGAAKMRLPMAHSTGLRRGFLMRTV